MLYEANSKRHLSHVTGRTFGLLSVLLSIVATVLGRPVAAQSEDGFPNAMSHSFGAAFSSTTHGHSDRGPELNGRDRLLAPGQIIIEVDPSQVEHAARWDQPSERLSRDDLLERTARSLQTANLHNVYPDQQISWLFTGDNQWVRKESSVLGFATLAPDGRDGQSGCADDLVVLTDLPFDQGTSGGAVIDKQSGKILGIIQGTLNQKILHSGIGKPGFFNPSPASPVLL